MTQHQDSPLIRPPKRRHTKKTDGSPRAQRKGHLKPPVIGGFSTKNSHTSPKRIAQRKREAEALQLREQGYSHAQIGEHMDLSPSQVCRMVFAAMDKLIPVETAERVRTLELKRLDAIQSELWEDVTRGNLGAIHAYLRLSDQRSRLMGLYPREGQQVQVGAPGNDAPIDLHVNFVVPSKKLEPVLDVSPYQDAQPDYNVPAIEKPPQREVTPTGAIYERRGHPSYESQTGEPQPSIFDAPGSWMK
jgi:hypothetical protein